MYLPSFYKLKNEFQLWKTMRNGKMGPIFGLWLGWAFYPSLYNLVFTDIFPPAKGKILIIKLLQEELKIERN